MCMIYLIQGNLLPMKRYVSLYIPRKAQAYFPKKLCTTTLYCCTERHIETLKTLALPNRLVQLRKHTCRPYMQRYTVLPGFQLRPTLPSNCNIYTYPFKIPNIKKKKSQLIQTHTDTHTQRNPYQTSIQSPRRETAL